MPNPENAGPAQKQQQAGTDSRALREKAIPLPGPSQGYKRLLLLGVTGAGKTTLVRQLIGTTDQGLPFPATSSDRTTTAGIELISDEAELHCCAVTFLSRDRVREYIAANLYAAIQARRDGEELDQIRVNLLESEDQRFRLSYIIGNKTEESQTSEETRILATRLRGYLDRICQLADGVKQAVDEQSTQAGTEGGAADRCLEKDRRFQTLVDDILQAVQDRLLSLIRQRGQLETGEGGWPLLWSFQGSDQTLFFQHLSRFTGNDAKLFGQLLTPLVDGVRVAGPLRPVWWPEGQTFPKLVIIDTVGVGHSLASGITTHLQDSDAILMVDKADSPMTRETARVLTTLWADGHQSKLLTAFTRFDRVEGDCFANEDDKRDHVCGAIANAIGSIAKENGEGARDALRKVTRKDRVFFFAKLDKPLGSDPQNCRQELERLIEAITRVSAPPVPTKAVPVYDPQLLDVWVNKGVARFHRSWREKLGLTHNSFKNWSRIKALTRRLGYMGEDHYMELAPVADLRDDLMFLISQWLDKPTSWNSDQFPDDMRQQAVDQVKQEVSHRLEDWVVEQIWNQRIDEWREAHDIYKKPPAKLRAEAITAIFDETAPRIEEAEDIVNQFVKEIRGLVVGGIQAGGGHVRPG